MREARRGRRAPVGPWLARVLSAGFVTAVVVLGAGVAGSGRAAWAAGSPATAPASGATAPASGSTTPAGGSAVPLPAGPGTVPGGPAATTNAPLSGRAKAGAVLGAALLIAVLWAFSQGYGILGGRARNRPTTGGRQRA